MRLVVTMLIGSSLLLTAACVSEEHAAAHAAKVRYERCLEENRADSDECEDDRQRWAQRYDEYERRAAEECPTNCDKTWKP